MTLFYLPLKISAEPLSLFTSLDAPVFDLAEDFYTAQIIITESKHSRFTFFNEFKLSVIEYLASGKLKCEV